MFCLFALSSTPIPNAFSQKQQQQQQLIHSLFISIVGLRTIYGVRIYPKDR